MTISAGKHLIPKRTKDCASVNRGAKIHIQFFLLRMERSSLYSPIYYFEWQSVVEDHMAKQKNTKLIGHVSHLRLHFINCPHGGIIFDRESTSKAVLKPQKIFLFLLLLLDICF